MKTCIEIDSEPTLHADPHQLAEIAVSGPMVRAVIAAIQRLRASPAAT